MCAAANETRNAKLAIFSDVGYGMGSFLDVVWVVLALGVSFQMKGEGASHFTFSTEGKYTVVCEIIKIYNINTFSKERKREREKERYSFQLWECKR